MAVLELDVYTKSSLCTQVRNWIKSVDLIWKTTEYTRTFGVVSRKLSKPKKMDSNPRKSWKGRADGRHATKQLTTAHKSAND